MATTSRWIPRATQVVLLLAGAGCGENEPNVPPEVLFIASGSLTNRSGQPIPSTARVVVGWSVTANGPDYTYVLGAGTIQGSTFNVVFHHLPPAEALNSDQLGVGIVFLSTNPDVTDGDHLEDVVLDPAEIIGATGRFAVIYKATDVVDQVDWEGAFPLGWNAGIGVDRVGNFDAFAPTPTASMELIVDDLNNIDFVEWS